MIVLVFVRVFHHHSTLLKGKISNGVTIGNLAIFRKLINSLQFTETKLVTKAQKVRQNNLHILRTTDLYTMIVFAKTQLS